MAPGPISRKYATQEDFDELQDKVGRMRVSMELMADVIKILTIKIYGEQPGEESINDIHTRCLKIIEEDM